MQKLRVLWDFIFQKGKMNIYRRILRTAIWGSFLTFISMGAIFFASTFFFHYESNIHSKNFAHQMRDYLEELLKEAFQADITETNLLRAQLVKRLLEGCTLNVELLSEKMTDILKHRNDHMPKTLPVANDTIVEDYVPYLYYTPDLTAQGISEELRQEISYASSIDDDMKHVRHRYYGTVLLASKNGYMIRMDMIDNDNHGSILSYEPLRSTYDHRNRKWYKDTVQANKLIFTEPYMATYDKMCISICAPYYDDNGIAGVVAADIDTEYICDRLKSSYVDGSEFSFVMDKHGHIVISPQTDGIFAATNTETDSKALSELLACIKSQQTGIIPFKTDEEEYYLAYAPLSKIEWTIVTVIDQSEIREGGKKIETYVNKLFKDYNNGRESFLIVIVLTACLFFVITLYPILKINVKMAKGFVAPIKLLTDGVQEISDGNLQKKLSIKTEDEIEILAENVNNMTDKLSEYMENLTKTTAKNERIETELSVGTRIQSGMLPNGHNPYPDRKDFDLAAMMHPAKEVGGDFYDFYFLDECHLAITVADVSDKGVPAALFMVITKTLLKENLLFAGDSMKLGKVFEETNDTLVNSNEENMFVTVFSGVLDTNTGNFVYVNAGHNPPIIKRDGICSYLEKADYPVMGAIEGLPYNVSLISLKKGDSLFLYTDGVTEAMNTERKLFGEQRLLNALKNSAGSAENDINKVYAEVKEYAGSAVQSDDITVLEIIYTGSQERND